jgi:hypothetical protein
MIASLVTNAGPARNASAIFCASVILAEGLISICADAATAVKRINESALVMLAPIQNCL